jgi:UDPglucose 6-dehydrogenase
VKSMKICVQGLWHLGTVTAACLASAGHQVVGLDFEHENVERLRKGTPPLFEPGLEELLQKGIRDGRLSFTTDIPQAVEGIDLLWIAYDTPVDDDDQADVPFVLDRVKQTLPHLRGRPLVLISSQLPAGSTRSLETGDATFAYSPENLRLGKAIAAFTQPERVIAGVRNERDRKLIEDLFAAFTNRVEFMSVESAEMTKHALNAFLATSVSFINEIAAICEQVGADAKEVERGLKSEARIGPKAYLSPGGAFAGGTLARDIAFLTRIAQSNGVPADLLSGVRTSNNKHRQWARRRLQTVLGDLKGKTIAVWGLTYKPGTDTLRRSSSIELCEWLSETGARIQAHDPAVKTLPLGLVDRIQLFDTPLAALKESVALVVATEWPEFSQVDGESIPKAMRSPVVFDANRFLAKQLESRNDLRYFTVGKS